MVCYITLTMYVPEDGKYYVNSLLSSTEIYLTFVLILGLMGYYVLTQRDNIIWLWIFGNVSGFVAHF